MLQRLFLLFLLGTCFPALAQKEGFRFTLGYCEFIDSGNRHLYFCNDWLDFLQKITWESAQREDAGYDDMKTLFSGKIINKGYHDDLKTLLDQWIIYDVSGNGMVWIEFLDDNGTIVKKGTVEKKNYIVLQTAIEQLNVKYGIAQQELSMINWFFDTLEKGTYYNETADREVKN